MTDWRPEQPRPENWMRGPGDRAEVEREASRFEVEIRDLALMVEAAAAHFIDVDGGGLPWDLTLEAANLGGFYLWAAASLGSRRAAFALADRIRIHARGDGTGQDDVLDLMALADEWEERGEGKVARLRPVQAAPARPPSFRPGHGHVVVASIGDPKSKEGAELAKRLEGAVGVPLPFRGTVPAKGTIQEVLTREWPWAAHVAQHIERQVAIGRAVGSRFHSLKPMLFVGPPGSGKTALAVRLAELLGLHASLIPAGGASDAAGLSAVTRGWASARPCGPVLAAAAGGCCDPAIIVDELDKAGALNGRNGSVMGTLLGMLGKPESFQDACLLAEADLSKMLFMATANDLGAIPEALLDRFNVFVVGRPKEEHFDVVLAAMRCQTAREMGVRPEFLPQLDADEYGALRKHFAGSGCSLREFGRAFAYVLSEATERVASASPSMS